MKEEKTIWPDGTVCYIKNGKYHREDGPTAVRLDGTVCYIKNNKHHREDGPAVIWPDGDTHYYYLDGVFIDEKRPSNWEYIVKEYHIQKVLEE